MAHRVTTEVRGGNKVYTLHDTNAGSSAAVLPAFGFNLFDLRLPVAGKILPVIDAAPDLADNPRQASHGGNPILFPYPNRVKDGKFTFGGKSYSLPINNGTNAIHGFAVDAKWDVEGTSTDGDEAAITGRYQISTSTPAMLEHWPTDAVLKVRFGLSGRRLTMTVTVDNPTADPLPYGFGIHPYFRCPFTPGGDLSRTRVIVPASEYWPLHDFIPTGVRKPVDAHLDFRKGQPMEGLKLDDVLTGLTHTDGKVVCRLIDEDLKAEFRLIGDQSIRELVVFTPPWAKGVIAIEPYTQTTDAVNLATRGIDGGLRVLKHGASETFTVVMETVG